MSKLYEPTFSHPLGAVIRKTGVGILFASGTSVPSNGGADFAPGCIFLKEGGTVGAQLYVNEGSATSCDFNVFALGTVDLSGLTATAAEINARAAAASRIVNVTDAATYTVLAANSGKIHIMPDFTSSCTLALPALSAGLEYTFISKAVAADAQNWIFQGAEAGTSFLGGVSFADTDAGAGADEIHAGVWPNGSSNDFHTIVTPGAGTRIHMICDGTNWIVNGQVFSATVPTFSDT